MKERTEKFIVFVDTSYLTYMAASEKAGWNKLIEHSKACVSDLNTRPLLEIHISEIALREFRERMIDDLVSKIDGAQKSISTLKAEWRRNELAKQFELTPLFTEEIFPTSDQIDSAANHPIEYLLKAGVKRINMETHHSDAVWEKYFNWEPPFNVQSPSERADPNLRDKRRVHFPDAWILESAIDAEKDGLNMLCLCKDGKLSDALKSHDHSVFKSANDIINILFPPVPVEETGSSVKPEENTTSDLESLDTLLSRTTNMQMKDIYLHLLGYVVPLIDPTHEELITAVALRGFDHKLIEACAVILSDKSRPYIVDTGNHYIVGDKVICEEAAGQLTQEIAELVDLG